MFKLATFLKQELNKKIWNSPFQLFMGAIVLYGMTAAVGTTYACGPGNSDVILKGVFKCANGDMVALGKLVIIGGLALASLCLGRAVSLVEKRHPDLE